MLVRFISTLHNRPNILGDFLSQKGEELNFLVYEIRDRQGNVYGVYETHQEALEGLKNIRQNDSCGYYTIELCTKGE